VDDCPSDHHDLPLRIASARSPYVRSGDAADMTALPGPVGVAAVRLGPQAALGAAIGAVLAQATSSSG